MPEIIATWFGRWWTKKDAELLRNVLVQGFNNSPNQDWSESEKSIIKGAISYLNKMLDSNRSKEGED